MTENISKYMQLCDIFTYHKLLSLSVATFLFKKRDTRLHLRDAWLGFLLTYLHIHTFTSASINYLCASL